MSVPIIDKTVTVYRLTQDTANNNREQYEVALTGVKMNIQPVAPEYEAAIGDGSIGRSFNAYTTQSGIQSTMIITESGSTTVSGMKYTVTGVLDWSSPNLLPHFELTLTKLAD